MPQAHAVDEAQDARASEVSWQSWRNLWQVPTIVVSVALIVMGMRSFVKPASEHDFEGALTQVEQFISSGELDDAYSQLRMMLEPNVDQASPAHQARFHAASADFTFASQQATGQRSEANNRHIANQYAIAEELGLVFSPVRRERWGEAMLALGEIEAAEHQLHQLEKLLSAASSPSSPHSAAAAVEQAAGSAAPDSLVDSALEPADGAVVPSPELARQAHTRLFRSVLEAHLQQPNLDVSRVMHMLAEYRLNTPLTQHQRVWVAARLAELRLENGEVDDAISGLLVEMRRLESDQGPDLDENFGELYVLLARGYHEKGDTRSAREHLDRAVQLLRPSASARGEALVLLGRIALAHAESDAAMERFTSVVNEFVGTRAHLPGLLGKAECASLSGDHSTAQADFREVVALVRKSPPRRDVTPEIVAQRLCDRHDAALAIGRAERALEYASIAEALYEPDAVPPDVLIRKASTNRQIAEDLLATMGVTHPQMDRDGVSGLDAAARYEVNQRFITAGEDYLRHSASHGTQPLDDAEWGASLWLAADCFDRGGQHRQAIETFERYLGSRPPDDARRAEGMFRIAQGHEALMDYEQAAHAYELLRDDRARTSFAAQCHVPLARCYQALGRTSDARRTLEEVVSGQRLLSPEASDYRQALRELARLLHEQGEYVLAIERLSEVVKRYPDDSHSAETRYLLGDSYRRLAREIEHRLALDAGLAPAEHTRLKDIKNGHLHQAADIFAGIAQDPSTSSGQAVESEMDELIRRAHLYHADCVFELGRFTEAVDLYESASRHYSTAASSMYALVQIVNCYAALGDGERAAAAHQRALLRLQQLPDTAFASPDSLMDRTAWERWLRNSPVGERAIANYAEAGSASG